jgi:hypothetical protein
MGFASMLNSNFLLESVASINNINRWTVLYSNSPWYKENFNTNFKFGAVPITESTQVSALIPYHFHRRETATGDQQSAGMGDITDASNVSSVSDPKKTALLMHTLQLGGGVKAPTGEILMR